MYKLMYKLKKYIASKVFNRT